MSYLLWKFYENTNKTKPISKKLFMVFLHNATAVIMKARVINNNQGCVMFSQFLNLTYSQHYPVYCSFLYYIVGCFASFNPHYDEYMNTQCGIRWPQQIIYTLNLVLYTLAAKCSCAFHELAQPRPQRKQILLKRPRAHAPLLFHSATLARFTFRILFQKT